MSSSTQQPLQILPTLPAQPFRLDVPLHDLLQKAPDHPSLARAERETQPSLTLPSPVFPQHPALLHEIDAADIAAHEAVLQTGKRHWPASKVMKTMRGWMLPYIKSRVLPGDFQPIIAYLCTTTARAESTKATASPRVSGTECSRRDSPKLCAVP